MSELKYNEVRRQCRYNFTQQEINAIGKQAADDGYNKASAEADFERIKKDYKARIEGYEVSIEAAFEKMRSGYELRETLCFFEYNNPRPGRKICRRADTLEVVGEEDMTGKDTQTVMEALDAEAAAAKEETPEPKKGPILVLAAPEPPVDPWPESENIIARKDSNYGSDKFNSASCEIFTGLLRDLYYPIPGGECADDDEVREGVCENILVLGDCGDFLAWLEERPRPGGRKVVAVLRASGVKTPANVESEEREAETKPTAPGHKTAKSKGPKARRTASNGVVGVDADGDDLSNEDDKKNGN